MSPEGPDCDFGPGRLAYAARQTSLALMSRRPASITQADVARAIRAARQTGAAEIELRVGGAIILIRLAPSPSTGQESALEPGKDIVL